MKLLNSFIVHGQDEKAKYELKNYLQNTLHMPEPVILHEKANLGRSIIQKFEEESNNIDVVFVLLTPDDHFLSPQNKGIEIHRARQNVIFELGYFYSELKRLSGKIILLYKGNLDLPSDLSGLIYLPFNESILEVGERIRIELENL